MLRFIFPRSLNSTKQGKSPTLKSSWCEFSLQKATFLIVVLWGDVNERAPFEVLETFVSGCCRQNRRDFLFIFFKRFPFYHAWIESFAQFSEAKAGWFGKIYEAKENETRVPCVHGRQIVATLLAQVKAFENTVDAQVNCTLVSINFHLSAMSRYILGSFSVGRLLAHSLTHPLSLSMLCELKISNSFFVAHRHIFLASF